MKKGGIKALVLNPQDNVGIALQGLDAGTELNLKVNDKKITVKLREPITYQHKFSIMPIDSGTRIIKFGEVIGKATQDIKSGQHVHTHNMIGLRIGKTVGKRSQ